MKQVYLLLGSNRGDREKLLEQAREMISRRAGFIVRASSVHETPPEGFTDIIPFLNQALEIETTHEPENLLEILLSIERELGRKREGAPGFGNAEKQCFNDNRFRESEKQTCPLPRKFAARTMDIDILFYGNRLIFTETLMIPHPRLHERMFVLAPLNEIAPGFIHPVHRKTVSELLRQISGNRK
jgi:2-amino-4-hydroxy-6-hydroxymethyldihydropteridine diphosphokinase